MCGRGSLCEDERICGRRMSRWRGCVGEGNLSGRRMSRWRGCVGEGNLSGRRDVWVRRMHERGG